MKEEDLTIYNPGDPQPESRTDWERLRKMTDEDIERADAEDPDTFIPDEAFWAEAKLVLPENKRQVTLRVDAEVLDYFRKEGPGYQTRMNAVLRSYVEQFKKHA
jgi:uncharacterized protein (DUF4415 family)